MTFRFTLNTLIICIIYIVGKTGCYKNTGLGNALHAEISGAMRAIELAHSYNWKNLWVEANSKLVGDAFKNPSLVPWRLRNRWRNSLLLTSQMNFLATHIYREGNQCANTLANFGHNVPNLIF